MAIINQFKLKDKEIERAEVIESNVNKVIASRFKKRGMSWSKRGALALLKIKEAVINGEWDIWWEKERERNIKIGKYKILVTGPICLKAPLPWPVLRKKQRLLLLSR
ncbi:hypothetical protein ES708_18294 [subsurface metagenome]